MDAWRRGVRTAGLAGAAGAVPGGWVVNDHRRWRALGLPLTYTLIYAARDERDVATFERILVAAIAQMTRVTG